MLTWPPGPGLSAQGRVPKVPSDGVTAGASTLGCARPARARGGAKEAILENLPSLESPISKAKRIRENHTAPGILRLCLNFDFRFPFVSITGSTVGFMQTVLDRAGARPTGALGLPVGPCVPKGPCFRVAEGFCQPLIQSQGIQTTSRFSNFCQNLCACLLPRKTVLPMPGSRRC